jgi:hypothetical protein
MKRPFAILLVALSAGSSNSAAFAADHRIHLAQSGPAPASCTVGCGNQAGTCQSTCLGIISGVATNSITVVGSTTDPTQCYMNCTNQQLLCEQGCPRQ